MTCDKVICSDIPDNYFAVSQTVHQEVNTAVENYKKMAKNQDLGTNRIFLRNMNIKHKHAESRVPTFSKLTLGFLPNISKNVGIFFREWQIMNMRTIRREIRARRCSRFRVV